MRIYVNVVAVRDGFQIEKAFVPTATKVELINQLARTGLHKIEVTSFVSPKAVPALADANEVLAGIEAGVRSFDGSVSGLGGCPFAPGATGNICTEDMVNMLEDMGYDTRVDLAKLLAVARRIPVVVGHDVPGQVMKAGQTLELHDPPEFLRS